MQRHDDAYESFDRAVQADENDVVAWLNRGLALEELERYEEAVESFERVINLNPKSFKALVNRGHGLTKLKRFQEAIASLDQALDIQSDYAPAYYRKAVCYVSQGEIDLGLETLQRAVELDPKYQAEARTDETFNRLSRDDWFRQIIGDV